MGSGRSGEGGKGVGGGGGGGAKGASIHARLPTATSIKSASYTPPPPGRWNLKSDEHNIQHVTKVSADSLSIAASKVDRADRPFRNPAGASFNTELLSAHAFRLLLIMC